MSNPCTRIFMALWTSCVLALPQPSFALENSDGEQVNIKADQVTKGGNVFFTQATPLSPDEVIIYTECQQEDNDGEVYAAPGAADGDGLTGLEVAGVLFLIGLGVSALVLALAAS